MGVSYTLVVRHGDGASKKFEVKQGRHVLGRDPSCDLVIDSQEVSRRHARLEIFPDHFVVEDLGSTSGTYVLGRLLNAPQRLGIGHSFQLGTVSVELVSEAATKVATSGKAVSSPAQDSSAERYAQGTELGRGGMGVVRQTEDLKLGRHVAMKVMLETHKQSFDARLRFYQEAEVLARLEHPNIVPMHDLGIDANGRPYYTMKEVRGVTLQRILKQLREGDSESIRKYPLNHLLGVFQKVCDGVGFAHSKGIVHRDLKPENVMLGEFGEVLVMDWGLAKDLKTSSRGEESSGSGSGSRLPNESGSGLTMDGAVMGTPQYMPPEQAEGRLADIDERSDVFSLGALLYAILTLHPPVKGRTVAEVLENVKSGNISPPTSYNPGGSAHKTVLEAVEPVTAPKSPGLAHCPGGRVPGALSAVAMRALALKPEDRYQSVAMLATDVEDYLGGRATSAEQAGPLTLLWLWVQRNKAKVYPIAGACILVVIIALSLMGKIIASERTARLEAENARLESEKARAAGKTAEAALGRSQISLAEAAFRNMDVTAMVQALNATPETLRDDTWNYFSAKRDSTLCMLNLPGGGGADAVEAIPGRPGHFAIASQSAGKIFFVDALNNRVASTVDLAFSAKPGMAFSGDGRRLAAWGHKDGKVTLLDALTGRVLREFSGEKLANQNKQSCALNQDGSLLIVSTGTYVTCQVKLIETHTGVSRWERRARFARYIFHPNGQWVIEAGVTARWVVLLNVVDGREIFTHNTFTSCARLSPSGRVLAVGTKTGFVELLNATTGAVINSMRLHSGEIVDLEWTRDERLINVGSEGKFHELKLVLRVWDTDGFVPLSTHFGFKHGENPEWSFDRATGLLVTAESPPRVWRIPAGVEAKIIPHRAEQGFSLAFVTDRALVARTGYELGVYDPASSDIAEAPGLTGTGSYRQVASHWGTQRFALAKSHNNGPSDIRLFELNNNAPNALKNIALKRPVDFLSFDASGGKLLTVHTGGIANVWDAINGTALLQLDKPVRGNLNQALFLKDGQIAAFASVTRTATAAEDHLLLYSPAGKLLHTVSKHFQIDSLAASPDGKLVAIAGANQSISLYEAAGLKHLRTFRAHDDPVTAIAFHPTKPWIASASMDHAIKLWDHSSGKQVNYFIGPMGTPLALAFSPTGKYLALDGQDKVTRIWQLDNAEAPTQPMGAPPVPEARKRKNKAKQ